MTEEAPKPKAKIEAVPDSGSHEKYRHPILTDAQVDAAKAKARVKADKARIAEAMERLEDEEAERLKMEEGLVTGGPEDEMVRITLDLAPNTLWLSTNGKRFEHGKSYTVPTHVARDLLARQWKGWEGELARKGEDRFQSYQRARAPIVQVVGGKVAGITSNG